MGSQAERCSLSSSFPLLPSHGVQLPGSRLNGKYQQTVSSQILGQVLALAAISTPGHSNAMLLRSGATPALTTTTHAGTETTVSSRSTSGTAALVCATCPATGRLRTTATWVMTATTAGLETIARTGNLVDVPQCQALAVLTMVHHLALVSHALNLMSRRVTPLRCIATLVMTRRDAGTATTVSTRRTSGTVATECAV